MGGMVNVEELDPAPLISLMNRMGLVTRARHGTEDYVVEPQMAIAEQVSCDKVASMG